MKKNKQFVVIGLGRMGISVVETFVKNDCEVLAMDKIKENVELVADIATKAVIADSTDINVLKSLEIQNFDVAVIAIGENIEQSIMTAVLLKELGVKYIVAKAKNYHHKLVLEKIGVNKVILPEAEMGVRIATNLINKNVLDYIEFSTDYDILEIAAKSEWIGHSLIELDLRTKEGMNVIAIKKRNAYGNLDVSPSANYVIKENDVLVGIVSKEKSL